MTRQTTWLSLFMTILTFSLSSARAQEALNVDLISKDLATAVEAYGDTVNNARDTMIKSIDEQIEKAKANTVLSIERRISTIDELNSARTTFERDGKVPSIRQLGIQAKNFIRATETAKARCIAAYETAADAYGKVGDIEAAKRVLRELEEFRDPRPPKDGLNPGVRFAGIKSFASGEKRNASIEIKTRQGQKISGVFTVLIEKNKPMVSEFVGNVSVEQKNGRYEFELRTGPTSREPPIFAGSTDGTVISFSGKTSPKTLQSFEGKRIK